MCSAKIKDALQLKNVVVVLDQALYAEAGDTLILYLKWECFIKSALLSILGKHFQDAGLRDICIESGEIVEGSVSGALDGHRYNPAI